MMTKVLMEEVEEQNRLVSSVERVQRVQREVVHFGLVVGEVQLEEERLWKEEEQVLIDLEGKEVLEVVEELLLLV